MQLTDDGFTGSVGSKGHGLQRAYLMAALRALAEVERNRNSDGAEEGDHQGLLLAIEEPELFQHPGRSRFIARTLRELTSRDIDEVRVVACTHSPIFVDVEAFDSIRHIRKDPVTGSAGVHAATLDDVAARVSELHADGVARTGMGLRPGLVSLMNPFVSEAFFADFVVLVEGGEDKALLEAAIGQILGRDQVDALSLAFIPVGGKTNLDRMSAILELLDVPFFLVFDRDGEDGDSEEKIALWNRVLTAMAGCLPPADAPDTAIYPRGAVFSPTVSRVVQIEVGADNWIAIRDAVCANLGVVSRKNSVKNPEIVRRMLEAVKEKGMASPSLQAVAEAIAVAARGRVTGQN